QSNDRADSEATILALQADVASALSAKDALEARLSEAEQQRHGFASQLAEKERELTSLVEHYASRERRMPASPSTPPTPNTPVASCYVEMRVVELEEANQGLERDRDWLKAGSFNASAPAQLDSLTAQFNAEADRLRSSLAESEQALRSAEELGRSLRDEVSSLGAKLRASEEETRALQEANADLQTLVTTGGKQLREVQSRLEDLSQRHAAAEREAVASREANEALRLHNESLQSSLATSEGGRAAAVQTVLALQEQVRQALAAREEDASSLHELRRHCEALSSRNEAGEASLKSTCAQLADAQARSDRLNNENRALNDRIRDLEVRTTDLLRLQEQAEDRYRSCFREKEENERQLKEQVEALSSEAGDSASLVEGLQADVSRLSQEVDRLLREVEKLAAEVEDARKRASDSLVQERELQEQLRANGDRCEVLVAQSKLLDEQKEQLGVKLKAIPKVSFVYIAYRNISSHCPSQSHRPPHFLGQYRFKKNNHVITYSINNSTRTLRSANTHPTRMTQSRTSQLEDIRDKVKQRRRKRHFFFLSANVKWLRSRSFSRHVATAVVQCFRQSQRVNEALLERVTQTFNLDDTNLEGSRKILISFEIRMNEKTSQISILKQRRGRATCNLLVTLLAKEVCNILRSLLFFFDAAQEVFFSQLPTALNPQVARLSFAVLKSKDGSSTKSRSQSSIVKFSSGSGGLATELSDATLTGCVNVVYHRSYDPTVRKEKLNRRHEKVEKVRYGASLSWSSLFAVKKTMLSDVPLQAKLDSLTTQFNAEASRLRTSLTESEQAIVSMKELQARYQDEASSLGKKLRTSEEERDALRKANADLRAFATTGSQQLEDMRRQLDDVSQQRDSIGREARFLRKAGEALQLQNQLLRSSLETSEARKAAAEASCMEETRSIRTLQEQLQEALSARKDDESSLQMLRQDCTDLRAQNESGGASLESTRAELAEALARCSRLDDENQALRDLVGDLEVQLKNLEHLKKRAEDDYYKCVEEKERHKDALKEHIEALASEARDLASAVRESQSEASKLREENGRLALEVERLKTEAEEAAKRAHDGSERREKELLQESRLHVARCEAATARCELLEKENERLGADLKTAKESYSRKLQAAFSEMTTESNKRISAFKKREVALREENEALKKKCEDEKASHEKREKL
ncbi:unnamed protein product, partial [Ixodes pacificus]